MRCADPDNVPPLVGCCRDPGAPRLQHPADDVPNAGITRRRHGAQHRERRVVGDSPASRQQALLHSCHYLRGPLHVGGITLPSGSAERQEQAQPEKPPRPLDGVQIWIQLRDAGGHEVGRDTECFAQHLRVARDEHAAAHRGREPFMRVDRYGVGQLDARKQSP